MNYTLTDDFGLATYMEPHHQHYKVNINTGDSRIMKNDVITIDTNLKSVDGESFSLVESDNERIVTSEPSKTDSIIGKIIQVERSLI